jgi:hypothetical protein
MAVLLLWLLASASQEQDTTKEVSFTGKVVLLQSVLKREGILADEENVANQIVLERADGQIVPLVSNGASRALVLDERLRDRPIEIQGLKRDRLPHLEVVLFQVEVEGRLRIPEYWCDVCAISMRAPQICPCCQGPMELRYKPAAGD